LTYLEIIKLWAPIPCKGVLLRGKMTQLHCMIPCPDQEKVSTGQTHPVP